MKKIKVLGKQHLQGTSKKTGKPYNINIVHYVDEDKYVTGLAAKTITLDGVEYPFDTIALNAEYNIEYGERGVIESFKRA